MPVTVRPAASEDADVITDFNCRLAEETEGRSLDRPTVFSGVSRGLQLHEEVQYFVAESAGAPVGQLMLTREWSDWRNGWMAWLQSVYVLPGFRRQGVFRQLFEHCRGHVQKAPDVVGLRLYVDDGNLTAQKTYERLGFQTADYRVLELSLR